MQQTTRWLVTREQVLATVCPKCLSCANEPCVYVNQAIDPRYRHSPTSGLTLERIGKPTKVPHPERNYAARRALPFPKGRRRLKPAREALRDFEVQEYLDLLAWLKEHGSIFQTTDPPVHHECKGTQ